MFRSFIPFILASLGLTMISWATKMPLFEWQFNKIVTDFSEVCDGTLPSHWTTRFGEDLEARSRSSVLENLNIVVRRPPADQLLDRISLSLYKSRLLLFIVVVLSIGYIWWFLLRDKPDRASHLVIAVVFSVVALFICLLLSQVVRLAGPAVGRLPYYSEIRDCHGLITFSANLSKVHYETVLVVLMSLLSEAGALGVMLYQIIRAVRKQGSVN